MVNLCGWLAKYLLLVVNIFGGLVTKLIMKLKPPPIFLPYHIIEYIWDDAVIMLFDQKML